MAQSIEESLLQAIKNDDIKAFNALTETAQRGAYRLGRFPVLSLMYLYKSRRLLSAYEEEFLKITDYKELREPVEVSKKFSSKAGKCLRLYFSEIVSPLEMLLVSDKIKRLKRVYPLAKPAAAVKERLKSIYSIKYSLSVKFEGDNIILDRRPLSYREKKNIATACLCAVLGVTFVVGVPVTTVALIPKRVEGEVTKLSHIDFNSDKEYTLKRDVVIPENYSVEKVNCKITGEGKKLIFGKGATLGEFNGEMSGVTIESSGAVFTSVAENAKIENVTVNVNADVTSAEGTALVAVTNFGTIDGVTVNVSGKICALAPSEANTELTFAGLVLNNSYRYISSTQTVYRGVIKNCTVNYSGFSLSGEAEANASFGGVAGINSGYLQDCTVKGEITADTFDIAGMCTLNNGLLSGDVNEADISQVSAETGWNPIVCGIVLNNTYAVEKCINKGRISSVSTCGQSELKEGVAPSVSAAGIVYLTSNSIESCKNSGEVSARGFGEAYAGGIASYSYARLYNCFSDGGITATAEKAYAGGILGYSKVYYEATLFGYSFAWGEAINCISKSKINVTPINENTPAYAGGIIGYIEQTGINLGGETMYFGGGACDCYFVGEWVSSGAYSGNIIGVCGADIYESNSYYSGNTEYHNFENNYYLDNSIKAFGATAAENGSFVLVEDKGAASAAIEEIENSEAYKSILSALKLQ